MCIRDRAKGVKDLNITWTQLADLKGWQNSGAALYGVNSIPHTVLVDKDGTIIAKNLHGQELEDKIKEAVSYTHLDVYKRQVPFCSVYLNAFDTKLRIIFFKLGTSVFQ